MSPARARKLPAALVLLALLAAGCGDADDEEERGGPAREEVQAALDRAVDAGAPGIAVDIRGPEGDQFLSAGVASRDPEREISEEDHFRIASVTKSFTATIVMQLVEEGELALEQTVEEVAPGLIAAGERVTIRDLLAHSSGLPDYVKSEAFARQVASGEPLTPEGVLELVADQPLAFEPGSRYAYSDSDNIVLGLIIERLSRRSFEEELQVRVLEPIGLEQTTLATEPGDLPDPHFDGYQFDPEAGTGPPENVTDAPIDPNGAWASGALVSTARDVATFFENLMAGALVGRDQLELMMETVPGAGSPPGPGENRAGLGIFGWEVFCGEVWGHTGSFPGYRTLGAASEDGEFAVAFLVNATEVPERTERAILRAQELAICHALGEDAE